MKCLSWLAILGAAKVTRPCDQHGLAWSEDALLSTFGAAEHVVEAGGKGFLCYREVLSRVLTEMGKTLGFHPDANECARFAASVGNWPAFANSEASLRELQSHGQRTTREQTA